jgi:hypothetical protein
MLRFPSSRRTSPKVGLERETTERFTRALDQAADAVCDQPQDVGNKQFVRAKGGS